MFDSFHRESAPMIGSSCLVVLGLAGHHFAKGNNPDLTVSRHCERRHRDGRVEKGFFVGRRWLVDRKAFEYDPRLGWAREHWFEWPDEQGNREPVESPAVP
jgi:hypothetical protein